MDSADARQPKRVYLRPGDGPVHLQGAMGEDLVADGDDCICECPPECECLDCNCDCPCACCGDEDYADAPELPPKLSGSVSFDLAEGVSIVATGGASPVAVNVGSEESPLWIVAPGADGDDVGFIPLVIAAANKVGKEVKKQQTPEAKEHRQEKKAERKAKRQMQVEAANRKPSLWERLTALLTGAKPAPNPTKIGALTYIGDDDLGAILVDTDGRRKFI
jgi:hypothetical protein